MSEMDSKIMDIDAFRKMINDALDAKLEPVRKELGELGRDLAKSSDNQKKMMDDASNLRRDMELLRRLGPPNPSGDSIANQRQKGQRYARPERESVSGALMRWQN